MTITQIITAQELIRDLKQQGKMEVRHVKETVMEVFEILGFSDILAII